MHTRIRPNLEKIKAAEWKKKVSHNFLLFLYTKSRRQILLAVCMWYLISASVISEWEKREG